VVDLAVRPGEQQGRAAAVVPPDDIGRATFGAAHLDDLTGAPTLTDLMTLDDEGITDLGMHDGTSSRLIVRAVVPGPTGAKVTAGRAI
jgi:hypothetical protein